MLNLVTYFNWTSIFEWYICGSMWLQKFDFKQTCLEEIELHAQNTITIRGPEVSMIVGTYVTI